MTSDQDTVSRDAPGIRNTARKASLLSLAGRYRRKSTEERRLLRETLMLSAATRFAILFLPFRVLRRMMDAREMDMRELDMRKMDMRKKDMRKKDAREPAPGFREVRLSGIENATVRQVVAAIYSVGRHVPWESTCLVQAASAIILLKRRGIPALLWLGVRMKDGGGMAPHAWVTSGRQVILGGGELDTYTPVAVFR